MEGSTDNQESYDDLWSFGEDVDIDEDPITEGLIEGINLNDLCDGKEVVFSLSAKNREFLENEQEKEKEVPRNISYDLNSMRENRMAPTMTQSFQEISRKMTNVTPDGLVKKKVITAGAGKIVPAHSCVMVHYNLFKEHHHLPFDSTYMRGRPEKIRLGQGETLIGLEYAIKTMKKKENSLFFIKWEYAFGALGCPDRIGKKCDIVADITVLNFVEFTFEIGPNDDPETLVPKMDFQKTIIQIKKLLHAGNNDFVKKNIKDATVSYKKALQILRNLRLRNEEEEKEMYKQKLKCLINLAVCYNKLGRHEMACIACQEALSIDPNCAKAHFHYGKASVALSNFRVAGRHLRQANKLKPKDEDILAEMQRLNDKRALFEMKDKLFWKKAFTSELTEDDSAELKAFEKELTKNLEECLQKNMDFALPIPESEEERKICDRMAAHINIEMEKTSDNYIFKISRHSSNNFDDSDDSDDMDDLADFSTLSISNNFTTTIDLNKSNKSPTDSKVSNDSPSHSKDPNNSPKPSDSHPSNESIDCHSEDSSESDSYHTNDPDKSNDSYHSYHSNDYSQSSDIYHSNDCSKSSDTYLTNDSYHSDGTNKSNYSSYSNSPYHSNNSSCTTSPQHSSSRNKTNGSGDSSAHNQSNDSQQSGGLNKSSDSKKSQHSDSHNKSNDSHCSKDSHDSNAHNKSNDSSRSSGHKSHDSRDHNKSSDSHHSSTHNKSNDSGKSNKSYRSESHKSNDSKHSSGHKSNESHDHNKSSDSHLSGGCNKSKDSQHSSKHNKSGDSNKSKKSHHSDSHNKSNDSHHSDSHNKSNDSHHSTGHNKSNDSNKSNKSHHSDSHNKSNDSHHSDSHNKSTDSHHSSDSHRSDGPRKSRYSILLKKHNKNDSNDPDNSNTSINSNEDK